MVKAEIIPRTLHFKEPAGTSRGVYLTHDVWYVRLTNPETGAIGLGECAPLPDLSCDSPLRLASHYRVGLGNQSIAVNQSISENQVYWNILRDFCDELERTGKLDYEALRPYPSMLFGLETALRQLETGSLALFDTIFSRGEEGIPINGLVWMGSFEKMFERLQTKIDAGYRCIKLKIGAIDFDDEMNLIKHIREHFGRETVELRVDANGAFSPEEALSRLKVLSLYDVHSIEQPIRAGQWDEMARIAASSPVPIALDEELIGVNDYAQKVALLDKIRPQYIILKPSLHGGIHGCTEWINLAEQRGIGWWMTSALESNVGLNAIAQWCATFNPTLPQGLGTGLLYTDNVDSPLYIEGDCLYFDPKDLDEIDGDLTDSTNSMGSTMSVTSKEGITINGNFHPKDEIMVTDRLDGVEDVELLAFLKEWFSDSRTVRVQTSGSTGVPKVMDVEKEKMLASAKMTIDYLGLTAGNTAYLCLPMRYIAGKMVVVRAILGRLNLLPARPSSHPLAGLEVAPYFAAMIPMQVYEALRVPKERRILSEIRELIIGGGPVDVEVEEALRSFNTRVWSTYGMTETLSHIALRRLSGEAADVWYTPFEGVSLSQAADGALVIDAPSVAANKLYTNDIVEMGTDNRFRIIGRKDNMINTGGVKIQIEEIEKEIRNLVDFPFMVSYVNDERLGQKVVLLVENIADFGEKPDRLMAIMHDWLPAYHSPRGVVVVDKLPMTPNGKPDRKRAAQLAEEGEHLYF